MADGSSAEIIGNIFVAGGAYLDSYTSVANKRTECFNWADQTWTQLNCVATEARSNAASLLYEGEMIVAGGEVGLHDHSLLTDTMKTLNVSDPTSTWKDFSVNLPVKCSGHKVVKYNDHLYISGGIVQGESREASDAVYEVQLVPPYSSKVLTRLQESICEHSMELFDQKLFILGGIHGGKTITNNVLQFDLIKNEWKEMPPLPYHLLSMATVLWKNNVIVLGGVDPHSYNTLDKVFMYDLINGQSQMLPCMKQKRTACTVVLTGNMVVVMGGFDGVSFLKSVECFNLEHQVWQDLPAMFEPRAFATAVVKPNK